MQAEDILIGDMHIPNTLRGCLSQPYFPRTDNLQIAGVWIICLATGILEPSAHLGKDTNEDILCLDCRLIISDR